MKIDKAEDLLNISDSNEIEIRIDDNNMIVAFTEHVRIKKLGLAVFDAIWFSKYADGDWVGDWSLALICEIGKDPKDFLYYEDSCFGQAVSNYVHSIGKSFDGKGCKIVNDKIG